MLHENGYCFVTTVRSQKLAQLLTVDPRSPSHTNSQAHTCFQVLMTIELMAANTHLREKNGTVLPLVAWQSVIHDVTCNNWLGAGIEPCQKLLTLLQLSKSIATSAIN